MSITKSAGQTMALAGALAQSLRAGDVITLCGDVGAGKTVFVKGLAQGLGITEPVTSPTYTLLHCYDSGRLRLYHFDFYRLQGDMTEEIGIEECLADPEAVCVIEWPSALPQVVPPVHISVCIEVLDASTRRITIDRGADTL